MKTTKHRHRSAIWNHFTRVECDSGRGAQCNCCGMLLSNRFGSTTNLIRHLRFKHSGIWENADARNESTKTENEDQEENNSGQTWEFIVQQEQPQVNSVPDKRENGDAPNGNPKIEAEVATEENEPDETWEFIVQQEKPQVNSVPVKRMKTPIRPHGTTNNIESSTEKTEVKVLRTKDDHIDQFGKYISSLLRNIPEERASKLQVEIVTLILTSSS